MEGSVSNRGLGRGPTLAVVALGLLAVLATGASVQSTEGGTTPGGPADSALYGVGDQSNIYTIGENTGAAVRASTITASGQTVAFEGERFGIDFNPVVDRLRM